MADGKQRARQVFMDVAELPEAERQAALRQACGGDAPLRAEVEALLRAERLAGGFMGNPTGMSRHAEDGPVATGPREHEGQMIGRYKLLQLIGEGGFGSVWLAEQHEPVKRRAALKIIK